MPIVLLLFTATIEFSRIIMLRHTLDNAAYEAARAGVVPGATAALVREKADDILHVTRATGYTVDVFPEEITDETSQISVMIHLPVASNGYGISHFFRKAELVSKATKPRLTIARVVPSKIPDIVADAETSSQTSTTPQVEDPPPNSPQPTAPPQSAPSPPTNPAPQPAPAPTPSPATPPKPNPPPAPAPGPEYQFPS